MKGENGISLINLVLRLLANRLLCPVFLGGKTTSFTNCSKSNLDDGNSEILPIFDVPLRSWGWEEGRA
jgi:hypothetical protein